MLSGDKCSGENRGEIGVYTRVGYGTFHLGGQRNLFMKGTFEQRAQSRKYVSHRDFYNIPGRGKVGSKAVGVFLPTFRKVILATFSLVLL